MSLKSKLESLPFKTEVENAGGKIYAVGGAVRDELLGIESKDLDILVCKLQQDELVTILKKYGRVDEVGESFGVIKFKDSSGDEIDIALPRTERKTGEGHKDFAVVSDPELPLIEDLKRRDFTINAMAFSVEDGIIDPYNGQKDIKNQVIKLVNDGAFKDDPLRMLRAVQFASRFAFTIDSKTQDEIIKWRTLIKSVSKERVVMELDKIAKKGAASLALSILKNTTLYDNIFPRYWYPQGGDDYLEGTQVKTLAELIFFLSGGNWCCATIAKQDLMCDNNTVRELKALTMLMEAFYNTDTSARVKLFQAMTIYPDIINTTLFTKGSQVDSNRRQFLIIDSELPRKLADVDCNGHVMMSLGIEGPEIAKAYKKVVRRIMSEKLKNKKEDIITYLKVEYGLL